MDASKFEPDNFGLTLEHGRASEVSDTDPLARLAPSARRAKPRVRIAIGAAVLLFVGAVAVSAVISFSASGSGQRSFASANTPVGVSGPAATKPNVTVEEAEVLVHVLGSVNRPGIVHLVLGARVLDAVSAAGGLSAEADASGINLARKVNDGEQLYVPTKAETTAMASKGASPFGLPSLNLGGGSVAISGGLVRLNTASVADLDTLPRVGPSLAQRIIDWRTANGGFTSVDQLREIAGIGDATFAGLKDKVTL